LNLDGESGRDDISDKGEIVVRFWMEDIAEADTVAVADARTAVTTNLERDSTAKSLEMVVSKLRLFATLANEAAKVSCVVSL
jgi:hypothetical protein